MIAYIMTWLKGFEKTAAGRSLNEYYCVYINQEEGQTKAIKVSSWQNCPAQEK